MFLAYIIQAEYLPTSNLAHHKTKYSGINDASTM